MSEIVARFDRIRRDAPDRALIHLPAVHRSWTANNLWQHAVQSRAPLSQVGVHQLILSAAGNRPEALSLLLACRGLNLPLMPVDSGTTLPEILNIASRFRARAIVLPSRLAIDRPARIEPLAPDLNLVMLAEAEPAEYKGPRSSS